MYILGGQRDKQPLWLVNDNLQPLHMVTIHSDMWVYNISSDTTLPLADGTTSQSKSLHFEITNIDKISCLSLSTF